MEMKRLIDLYPSAMNPRQPVNGDNVAERDALIDSIKRLGVLEPLLVRPTGEIVAGHRRFEASRAAGLTEVPVVVLNCTDSECTEIMIAENTQRKDLTISEIGLLLKMMVTDGLSKAKINSITSLAPARINDCLMVLDLPSDVRQLVDRLELSLNCARVILQFPLEDQSAIAKRAVKEKLNASGLSRLLKAQALETLPSDRFGETYAEQRQIDISWCLEYCIKIRTKLELYRGMEELPPFIGKIESRLQSVSRDIHALCEEMVDNARVRN